LKREVFTNNEQFKNFVLNEKNYGNQETRQ